MVLLGDKEDARGAQAGHDWKVQSRQEGGAEAEVSLRGLRLGEEGEESFLSPHYERRSCPAVCRVFPE